MRLPFTVMPVLPFRHGPLPTDIIAPLLAFDPFVAFDFLLLGPEDFEQGMQDALVTKRALPGHEISLAPFLTGALPADVLTCLLAFDPTISFNLLSLRSKQLSERVSVF